MHEKIKEKVAIVGYGPSRSQCPFEDESFEIWGMNEIYQVVPRLDILFELHDIRHVIESFRNKNHIEWLQNSPIPVYMVKKFDNRFKCPISASIAYPWAEIIAQYGTFLTCQVSEMLALAMLMEYKEVHLYGIDLSSSKGFGKEYSKQKESIAHFVGIAIGKGIKVYIPRESTLLKTTLIYGLQGSDEYRAALARLWSQNEEAAKKKEKEIKETEAGYWKAVGAMEVLEELQIVEEE
jgi:hypothetical protein